jgi:5-methylcytosine-specific restriction enzyme A
MDDIQSLIPKRRHLADGGPDHISNVIALCPNHHREAHFGTQRETLTSQFLIVVGNP